MIWLLKKIVKKSTLKFCTKIIIKKKKINKLLIKHLQQQLVKKQEKQKPIVNFILIIFR
jgi:hypothetical protein